VRTESELFDEWWEKYFFHSQKNIALAAWRDLIRMLQSGCLIPDSEYHPNQTLEDD
jgi:hypothetical protein